MTDLLRDLTGVRYTLADAQNFKETSLDRFILRQRVRECWRKQGGSYVLTPQNYTEEWDLPARREKAHKILAALKEGGRALLAEKNGTIVGFALLAGGLFGKSCRYADLAEFYVSEPLRGQGIGGRLFLGIAEEARKAGAQKLYISAHSAKESIAAYEKYGCATAEEPDAAHTEKEPFDLQLEYPLSARIYRTEEKEAYMPLLLLADEQPEMIARYLRECTMYVLDDGGVCGEVCVTDAGGGVLEIRNIAVAPGSQRRGAGGKLIRFLCMLYKGRYSVLRAGTGDSPLTLPFYQKYGFTVSHTVKDYFLKHYDHPIVEGGVQLKDMICLQKKL